MSRTEFYRKLWPFFDEEEIECLESWGVCELGCAPGCEFKGYESVCNELYYAATDLKEFNRCFKDILGRKITKREFDALEHQMMLEW